MGEHTFTKGVVSLLFPLIGTVMEHRSHISIPLDYKDKPGQREGSLQSVSDNLSLTPRPHMVG